MSDPALLRLALTTRAPQTKEELFWFFKEVIQVPCAPCGNTGKVMFPKPGICRACGGVGKRGFHFGRKAICADHSAPLDVLAELWFGTLRHVLLIANREGGKTQMLALLSHILMHFGRYSIAHMGSVEAQAFRARDYLQVLLNLEPWKKNIQGQLSQTQAALKNGAKIEWLTGTLAQACLPGSTRIITDLGLFDMREIVSRKLKVRVKSFNFNRQRFEWQPITAWHDNGAEEKFRMIVVENGLSLIATGNHLIPQPDGKKIELEQLNPGAFVCQAAHDDLLVAKIRYVGSIRLEDERRYDITVANNHNYCVGSGILVGNSGVHPELSILDECDQADPDVRQRFLKTPSGPRSCFIEASTHYIQMGTISQILRESPNLPVRKFCLWETLAHCDYDCDKMPQLDGSLGRCALYESIEHTADGRMQVTPLCGGTLARQCDGHIDVVHAQLQWAKSDPWSRRVEYLCEPPDRPIGGRAYWNYHSTQNRLAYNPDIQPNKPLEWTMDFGPGVGARMCSTILQTSPDGLEDWIVDEIVLGTSSTAEVIKEFLRRYGPDGCIAPQHSGGIWIYGDRSGHTRASTTGDTDYDLIVAALRNTPGFRLLVFSGDANPPLIDRLNLVNRLLCDEKGRRRLKVAQKCKETARELELMPLGADRKKDKSDKVQRVLGLSHIGDGIEYWAWKKYGRSGMVMGDENQRVMPVVALGNVRRESSILVSRSGRRTSVDR